MTFKKLLFICSLFLVLPCCAKDIVNNKLNYVNLDYWKNYNDEILINHMQTLYQNNHDLRIAALKTKQAEENIRLAAANQLPNASFDGSFSRVFRGPKTVFGNVVIPKYVQNEIFLPLNASYEIDIWGQNYLTRKSAKKQKEIAQLFENGFSEGTSTEGATESSESVNLDEINGYKPIAIIEIPSINLSQALVEGISDNVLQYFLGHFPDSAAPGQVGNFAIAGHRVSDYTDAFINLYKVTAGDKIIVKTHDKKYTYVIEENYIVNPDQVEVLDATENATITLITCTVGSKQRVIVKGTLQSTEDL